MDPLTSLSLSKDSQIILYADDILLYKPIKSHADAIALQSDITMVSNWISDWPEIKLCQNQIYDHFVQTFPTQFISIYTLIDSH